MTQYRRLREFPWNLISAAGFVVYTATLLGFLGQFHWFLDLFSHFRVQYLLGLSVISILLIIRKRYRSAAVYLTGVLINAAIILPLYVGGSPTAPEGSSTIRVMLLNVNTALGDSERVKQAIQEEAPDIIVLEEINYRWALDLKRLKTSYPHTCIQPRSDNFGIGLYSKYPLTHSEVVYIGDAQVPSIVATIETPQGPLSVVGTHPLPPGSADYSRLRNQQLEALVDYTQPDHPLIIVGDLNATPWNYYFKRLLKRGKLLDSSRGFGPQSTWPTHMPILRIPLDHCLHSSDICVVNRYVGENVNSDHFPLIVDIAIANQH